MLNYRKANIVFWQEIAFLTCKRHKHSSILRNYMLWTHCISLNLRLFIIPYLELNVVLFSSQTALLFDDKSRSGHPRHIGSIDPCCDVAEVVNGMYSQILTTSLHDQYLYLIATSLDNQHVLYRMLTAFYWNSWKQSVKTWAFIGQNFKYKVAVKKCVAIRPSKWQLREELKVAYGVEIGLAYS